METGIKASVEAAGGAALVREAAEAREAAAMGQQLALLGEEERLDGLLPVAPPPAPATGRIGRPKGAKNKRTAALSAYYLSRYGDPLEGLLALGSGDLAHTLAALRRLEAETGLKTGVGTIMELLQFKRGCLEAALPYLHAKLAPTDDQGEPVVPILALGIPKAGAAERVRAGGGFSIEDLVTIEEGEADQALSGAAGAGSHDAGSHDEG